MIEEIFTNLTRYLLMILFLVGWVAIPIFLYISYQNKRKREWVESQEFHLIKISVPKENEKGPLAAEQMFASLHGIFKPHKERAKEGELQEHISFEIATSGERISFYVWLPEHLKDFVEGQIYAQYPKAEFEDVSDYADQDFSDHHIVGTEILLNKNEVFPIKTFLNFEEVDPLSGITSVLAKIDDPDEHIWIQILVKPVDDSWHERGLAYINALREGRSPESKGFLNTFKSGFIAFAGDLLSAATTSPLEKPPQPVKLSSGEEAKIKSIEEKVSKLGFGVKIRIGYITKKSDLGAAKIKLRSIIGAFKQFNTTNLNGFQAGTTIIGERFVKDYKSRLFLDEGSVLNIEELASIFHLPNVSVETPRISWTGSKKGEPPENLPIITNTEKDKNISVFAETNFRHRKQKFGVKTDDRRRHMYLIGKTGVGKTNMMENMVISDIKVGHGVAVVDPHGDFVDSILQYIPKNRINDVIIFDPGDKEFPIAFNPLETVNKDQRDLVASGLISIFHKIWAESWGPRLEYILRNTILSLLSYPDSTMLGILRMLVDKDYRSKVIKKLNDPVIHDFWTKEFAQYNDKTRVEAVLPIQNKVGQFLSSPTIRNIVGQPKSKINMREIIDNKRILLLKLAQGQIGEDNSSLLGAMMITKMQLAAMSRTDIPEEERVDFYLYVDEFQNFATESFAKILSEARKYRLNLTLANQYIAQLSEEVRNAIFGNMGSLVCFRVGAGDAKYLAKEVEPVFEENDLVNLDKYHIYTKLSIDGITGNAFSAKTLKVPDEVEDNTEVIVKGSREKYATRRDIVEEKIKTWADKKKEVSIEAEDALDQGPEEDKSNKSYEEYSKYLEEAKEEKAKKLRNSINDKVINNDEAFSSSKELSKPEVEISEVEISKDSKSKDNNKPIESNKSQKIKEITSKILKSVNTTNTSKMDNEDNGNELEDFQKRIEELKRVDTGANKQEIKPGEVIDFKEED